jgi:hypothetical protein
MHFGTTFGNITVRISFITCVGHSLGLSFIWSATRPVTFFPAAVILLPKRKNFGGREINPPTMASD